MNDQALGGRLKTFFSKESSPLEYRCPLCKGVLQTQPEVFSCTPCGRVYPVCLGIPDFRVYPDPYIDFEADRAKGRRIAEKYPTTDFPGLVEYYWSITPGVPKELVSRYVRHALAGVNRGRHFLGTLEKQLPSRRLPLEGRCLDLGCGTGGLLVAAGQRFRQAVGIDIAFRWLVIAKKHLDEEGKAAPLICANAEHLPFAPEQFDLLTCQNVLEHTAHPEALLQEAHRALRAGGALVATTVNRFSLAPEPHVRVWGVGWVPRRWMDGYVRRIKGIRYQHIRLLSRRELGRLARRSPFKAGRPSLPSFSQEEQAGLGRGEKLLATLYSWARNVPGIRHFLLLCGPALQLVCIRKEATPKHEQGEKRKPSLFPSSPGEEKKVG